MLHKIIPATLKTQQALIDSIATHEKDRWHVVSMGEVFGGDVLVVVKDGRQYEHKVFPVIWKSRSELEAIIREYEKKDWVMCAIGECFGCNLMVLKREVHVQARD
ncbi:hypothetical protein JW905_06790 [bacterium]|nr:hypothetical protein [candidate division CSSED10-310 bacterium]